MTQYTIALTNCAFFARHGVFSEEETLGQRFFVDAKLQVDGGSALEEDSIEGTVDYGMAFRVIEEIVMGRRRYLIEALALDIARGLCDRFPMVVGSTVTVRKPNAPVQGILDDIAVTVSHGRSAP